MKKRHPHKTNILLVNITRLGDMLQATPTIAGMKMENPEAKITVLVEKQFESVCHTIPNIDQVLSIDLGMTVRSLVREGEGIVDAYQYVEETVKDLRGRKFDYCLNMSSSAYTAMLLRLIGIARNGGWTSDEEGYRIIESEWARLFATSVFHQNRQFNSLNLVDVFRCSADVDKHPSKLLINISDEANHYADELITQAKFTNSGPIIAVQAGASQGKRQWAPAHFIKMVRMLVDKYNARVILVGAEKERVIIDPIAAGVNSTNVLVAAGRTTVPQLSAVLAKSDVLVTGDTGPMHMSVAVGTPVVAMFLASAYGFETGPYSEGNLVLQPVIGCGPCNPNKPCARPDCHDTIDPEVIAELAIMRAKGDVTSVPPGLVDPRQAILYRSCFDEYGFCNLKALNSDAGDSLRTYRAAYRRTWLEDLGGFNFQSPQRSTLRQIREEIPGLSEAISLAEEGKRSIERLIGLIQNPAASGASLGTVGQNLSEIDRKIEQVGFHNPHLGPLSRMFIFAKENIQGTDASILASQMGVIYEDLNRRCTKFGMNFAALA